MAARVAARSPAEAPPYRWAILAACALLIGSVSVVWHAFSVFLVALIEDFGWSRAATSLGFTVFVFSTGLTGPNAGELMRRFGPRRVVFAGGLILAAGLAATSRMTQLWQFYLFFGVIAGAGFSLSGWVPVVTLLQMWFRRRLGTATGVASAGVGVGIMLLVPAIQASILAWGWRTTYLLMAVAALAVVLPVSLLVRDGPLGGGAGATAAGPGDDPYLVDRAWADRAWSLRAALRTRRYWLLLAGFFLASFTSQQVLAHQVAYLRGTGFPALASATIVGVVGVASIPAKISWGVLADRIGREATYSIGVALVIAAIIVLWLVPSVGFEGMPYVYAALIGTGYASSATLPPIVTADLFRGAAYGAIFGGIALASNTGSGFGAWLAGFIFDRTGSYDVAFGIAIAGALVSAACVWLAAPRGVRRVTLRVARGPADGASDRAPAGVTATERHGGDALVR